MEVGNDCDIKVFFGWLYFVCLRPFGEVWGGEEKKKRKGEKMASMPH